MHGKSNIFRKDIVLFLTAVFFAAFIFRDSFTSFFFQDDWFSLSISTAGNLEEFLSFFNPRVDLIYYRPLGMQVPFYIVQALFGINPIPFRVATLITHIFSGFMLYKIFKHAFPYKPYARVGSFLYLTSAIHYTTFYWAATIAFALAPAFFFTSFYLYLHKHMKYSFIVFLIGLLTNELLITLPIIIVAWEFFKSKKIHVRTIVPYFLISLGYAVFRLTLAKAPTVGTYAVSFNIQKLMLNVRSYLLWTVNFPEEVHNQFVSFLRFNATFMQEFFSSIMILVTGIVVLIFVFVLFPGYFIFKEKDYSNLVRDLLLGIVWFFITLSPVLFFSDHLFSYYLPIPIVGIFFVWFTLFDRVPEKYLRKNNLLYMLFGAVIISWVVASIATVQFNREIHWAPRRANNAKKLITHIKEKYPAVEQQETIVVTKSEENIWALGDQNALQVLYQDKSIQTRYE